MGRVLLCMGKYAKNPYLVEKVYMKVYSVEELCYCLIQNVYLIDSEIMDKRLIGWLAQECGLEELAHKLEKSEKEGCTASEYVAIILEYVGYGDPKERERVRAGFEEEKGLSIYEKRKARADYFVENKKYVLALKSYDSLLKELPETERELSGKVFHNRGVAYAKLFQFKNAAESFHRAFGYSGDEASYLCYLAASRMRMSETEYVNFAAEQTQDYELALKVEKSLEDAAKDFEGTEESRMLFTLKVCREEKKSGSYYEELERITGQLKEQYREITAE